MNLEVHWSFLKHTEELLFRKVVTTYAIHQRSVSASLQIFSTKYYDLSILFLLFCQGKRGAGGWLSVWPGDSSESDFWERCLFWMKNNRLGWHKSFPFALPLLPAEDRKLQARNSRQKERGLGSWVPLRTSWEKYPRLMKSPMLGFWYSGRCHPLHFQWRDKGTVRLFL